MDQTTLYELLECSVCMEVLDGTSKVLPCQHTFCRRCLEEIVATKKHLQCPECRMPVTKRVEDLPPNILLVRLLETMKTMARQRGDGSQQLNKNARQTLAANKVTKSMGLQPSHPCAKALYNYDAQESGDLSFKRGDLVRLCKQVDENWYLGAISNDQGYFPATYVEVILPLPDEVPTCKALYDFVIEDEGEKDCLAFQKGDMITVLRRIDDNWVEGKLRDRIGIFPISFVEMNSSAKYLIGQGDALNASRTAANSTPGQTTVTKFSNTASGAMSGTTASSDMPLPMPTAAALRTTQAMYQRPSVNVPSGAVSESTPVASAISIGSARSKPLPLIYEALYNYKPTKEDEIELKKGECYTVSQKCRDGWFRGRALSTGVFGIFPGNYVKQIVLLPLDDLALVQPSITATSRPNHATVSRSMSVGAGRHNVTGRTPSRDIDTADGSPRSSHRPRSRPITNITQAQIRNAGNSALTTTARHNQVNGSGVVSGHGACCNPTWLNLMTSSQVSPDSTTCQPGNSESSGRNKVQRSATCRARSVSRVPQLAVSNTQSISDSLDSEDLRTMLRGFLSHESSDADTDSSVGNGCRLPATDLSNAAPGSVMSPDSDKLEKRSSLIKRWTSGMAKVKRTSATHGAATSPAMEGAENNAGASQERFTNLSTKPGGVCQASSGQTSQKPVKVSLMKVLPVSLTSIQSKGAARELYKCVIPYPAQNESELELRLGDVVYVVRKLEDGWFKGVLQRTGKSGLFPSRFVQSLCSL